MTTESTTSTKTAPRGLSADEKRVLDALLESMAAQPHDRLGSFPFEAFSRPALPTQDAACAKRLQSWLDLIGECPVSDPPADLVERTLDRVADVRRQRWFAEQAQALAGPRFGGASWSQVGAIAALLLVGFSLVAPMVGRVREDARRVACATNLQTAGAAMGAYAADFGGSLPNRGSKPGTVWWNVGRQDAGRGPVQSNSANLFTLAKSGHASPDLLNCPENKNAPRSMTRDMNDWPSAAAVSYSYQNQYAPQPVRIDRVPQIAILADKNPLFAGTQGAPGTGLHYRSELSPITASPFHRGKGQNILLGDGSVIWSGKPVLSNGDNIWLANGIERYTGTEAPADQSDSFLVP